ncbi:MAG: hypothetical protein ACE14P_12030 [Methanotrichaceae archaeon]
MTRILRVGESISGKYGGMTLDPNKKSFMLSLGDHEIYLPKDVGNSLLKRYEQGHDSFTIYRTIDVYEIKPNMGKEV